MTNGMKEFWHIVPINDGFSYLCVDKEGSHFLNRKEDGIIPELKLSFKSKQEAMLYISKHLDIEKYKPEKYWIK